MYSYIYNNLYLLIHVFLDEIWVESRVHPPEKIDKKPEIKKYIFATQLKNLLEKGIHSDITFFIQEREDKIEYKAHKAILSARSSYFDAMFRPNFMIESSKVEIEIVGYDSSSFEIMLEFLYTNEVEDLEDCNSFEIITLLEMSNEYLLPDLGILCEIAASKIVNFENIGKLMLLCARYSLIILREACKLFVAEHGNTLRKVRYACV